MPLTLAYMIVRSALALVAMSVRRDVSKDAELLVLRKAIRERRLNVASLVELESGRAPKPLVWTEQRIERWRRDLEEFTRAENQRRKRLAQLERGRCSRPCGR